MTEGEIRRMDEGSLERRFIALLLGLVIPGLGHVSRYRWYRGAGWFVTMAVVVTVVWLQADPGPVTSTAELIGAIQAEFETPLLIAVVGLHVVQATDAFAVTGDPTDTGTYVRID